MSLPAVPARSPEGLEGAGRLVDQHLKTDQTYVELSGQLKIATHQQTNCSGQTDVDYHALPPSLTSLPYMGQVNHVPLPPELLQEFENMLCNCAMGLMPEIKRAWLTIDSTIYMWNYEDGKDLAYFDGLSEVILAAGLVVPKPGVFQSHIRYLLCLTTAVEIVVLGVSFTATPADPYNEMHLQPEPLFHLPSDNVAMLAITGTPLGRIFLAGKDGCLYEVAYQAADGWFSRKCRKINHSVSRLSFLLPSFLSLSDEDPLIQLAVDSSRQILYTRSEKNTIQVFDLGRDGCGLSQVTSISMETIVQKATAALRTADKSLVKPLLRIAILPPSESSTLHLIAITQAGVRLYFTTTPDGVDARPSLLALVHARLPPGYSPSSATLRPGNTVHHAFYRKGLLVLSASKTEDKDNLWLVDPDLFPFQNALMESHIICPLDGRTWAIAESIEAGELEAVSSLYPLPPTVVSQHAQPPRRLILLTTQGSYLITKLRPVDQLQSLLEATRGGGGGGGEAVEGFFRLHKETQACAMCLILATGPDQQVAMWATEAFFRYGGEPHFTFPTTVGPASQLLGGASPATPNMAQHFSSYPSPGLSSSSLAAPHVVGPLSSMATPPHPHPPPPTALSPATPLQYSTPGSLGRALLGPEVQLSGKHDGLCRYMARILRPLWNETVAVSCKPPGSIQNEQLMSRYSPEEIAIFSEQMYSFKAFLERNPQLYPDQMSHPSPTNLHQRLLHFMRPEGMPTDSPAQVQQSMLNKYKADAYLLESNSLNNIYQLVVQCCECLSLWKLLCEYQFHLTANGLSLEQRQQLKFSTFRSLVVSGRQLTSSLISSLLNRYAGDTGMTDSLTARLRDLTPSLFSQDDAIASKATELVTMATTIKNRYEQLSMLRESLKKFSQVTHQITLPSVCDKYRALHYYEGVVELSLCAAGHKDPQRLGLHYYKSGQLPEDLAGQKAFLERQQAYSPITSALAQLLEQAPFSSPSVPIHPGPPSPQQQLEQLPDHRKDFEEMLTLALRSDDELFHVTLYSWLLSKNLSERLVEIHSPFLEDFLKYTASIQNDSRSILDLLWRFYEKNKDYGAAAKILDQLAHREGTELTLEERIEYISRAVMCAKSCNLATAASHTGEFLHELEEKMEVARVQLGILETLASLPTSTDVSKAIEMLNAELMDITKLYGDFAEPFGLAECKLAIVHCAGHYDPTLVESLWRDIIDNELRLSARDSTHTRMRAMKAKLVSLAQLYARSDRFFPLEYIVQLLEQHSCRLQWEVGFVHHTLQEVGVSLTTLFPIYDRMFKAKGDTSHHLHVLSVIYSLISVYVGSPSFIAAYERPSFNDKLLAAMSHYLVDLQTMDSGTPNIGQMVTNFRALQTQVQRIP